MGFDIWLGVRALTRERRAFFLRDFFVFVSFYAPGWHVDMFLIVPTVVCGSVVGKRNPAPGIGFHAAPCLEVEVEGGGRGGREGRQMSAAFCLVNFIEYQVCMGW